VLEGDENMETIESIEKAVASLPPEQLAEFRRWFAEFDAASWDARIEADALAGKCDALAQDALDEFAAGKAREV
jgi:hypothetical protein